MSKTFIPIIFCLLITSISAQEKDAIVVGGQGSKSGTTTQFSIAVPLEAKSPVAAEALNKFSSRLRRLKKIVSTLEISNASIKRGTTKIAFAGNRRGEMEMLMGGMDGGNTKKETEFEVSEKAQVRVTKLANLDFAKRMELVVMLVDALNEGKVLKKSGQGFGNNFAFNGVGISSVSGDSPNKQQGLISFDVADRKAIEKEATVIAVHNAWERAKMLAQLNGVKLGAVRRIIMDANRLNWVDGPLTCECTASVNIEFAIIH